MNRILIALAFLAAAVIAGLLLGPAALTSEIFALRLTRVLLGILAGGVLAFCGTTLQAISGNPLVEPYTIGTASGAALGAALGIAMGWTCAPLLGFAGAVASGSIAFFVARGKGGNLRERLILSGVVMSMLCSSLVMILLVTARRELHEIIYLLMGYLGIVVRPSDRPMLIVMGLAALVLVFWLYRYYREFDLLAAGSDTATALGMDSHRFTIQVYFANALLVSMVVALVGAIGFVGLIVPHLARLLVGPRHIRTLPAAFVLGAAFLVTSDTITRVATPYELPVGVVTSLFGVPFFLYLYRR